MITVFTDGSSVRGNPGDTGGAYVLMRDRQLLEALGFPLGRGTNNKGELSAAIRGLQACRQYLTQGEDVLLVADSLYLLQGLPKSDRLATDDSRPNRELWEQLYSELQLMYENNTPIRTYWVQGHSGNYGNTLCDHLAQAAAHDQICYKPIQKEKGHGRD